jgi:hypothetical protein
MNEGSNLNALLQNLHDEGNPPSSLNPSRHQSLNGGPVASSRSLRASHVDVTMSMRNRAGPTKQVSRLQLEGAPPRVSFNGFVEEEEAAGKGSFADGRNERLGASKSFLEKEPEGKLKRIGELDMYSLRERPVTIVGTIVSLLVLGE